MHCSFAYFARNSKEINTFDVFRWSFFKLVVVWSLILSESINKKTPLLEAETKLELFFIIQSIVRGFRGISRLTTTKNVSRFISIFNWMPIFVTCLIIMSNELVFDQPKSTKWKSFQSWLKLRRFQDWISYKGTLKC